MESIKKANYIYWKRLVLVNLKRCYKNMYIMFLNTFSFCFKGYSETLNSLKLSFRIIWGLRSNFFVCKSFLESNFPDILALCETILDDSIDSGNFSLRGYLLLIQKHSSTHLHGLAVSVKEGVSFAQGLSPENSADSSYLCFGLVLLHSVSYFFFLYWSPSLSLCSVFDSV